MIRKMLPVLLLMLPCAMPAMADERALQQALAKAQFMLKQTTAEKLAAEQALAALKQEFETFQKKSESRMQSQEQGAVKLAGNISALKERYIALADKYQTLQLEYRQAIQTGKTTEQALWQEQKKFDLCFDNNKKLFDINQEILGNYQDKGLWEVIREKEPFTGFASVQLEELIQEYQYRNEDMKLDESLVGTDPAR